MGGITYAVVYRPTLLPHRRFTTSFRGESCAITLNACRSIVNKSKYFRRGHFQLNSFTVSDVTIKAACVEIMKKNQLFVQNML